MRVIRELGNEISFNQPIVTLGTFDGVHLGHQAIIRSMIKEGRENGQETVLLTFDPHPRIVLYPDSHAVKLIDTVEEKLEKLKKLGLDTVILYPFTLKFSRLTAMEFVRDILVGQIGVKRMLVGHDHHFGKNREGSFDQLVELGALYGFDVTEVGAIASGDVTISSTKVRRALAEGEVETAASYLGQPYRMAGTVVHGNKLGRTIGFPTANIEINEPEKIVPAIGVYAVQVLLNGRALAGVMNIGHKPTVQDSDRISTEVFIFDFSEDIYGEELTVSLIARLRGEQKFESLDALKDQLKQDEQNARNRLISLV